MSGQSTSVHEAQRFSFSTVIREEGGLTIVEGGKDIPFDIKRIYYIHDIPAKSHRGFHAHKNLYQVIIAMKGEFVITLDDGKGKMRFPMTKLSEGLYVPCGLWRELEFPYKDTICLVLASEVYDEKDYIRDYNEFLKYKTTK